MKNKIPKIKSRTKGTNTVLEFSLNSIKLVQASFKNKGIITHLAYQDNISDSEDAFVNALTKIIKTERLAITNLIISLDRSLVSLRLLKLPSINEEEISGMSQWQAAKLLPYKIEELVVSHQTIKSAPDGFSYVLLIIAAKNIAKKFADICSALKLQPKAVTISSEGLLNWYREKRLVHSIEEAAALVDIDRKRFELAVLYQNKFIFSRTFNLTQIENDAQTKERIIQEAKLSVESYYKQEISLPIKRIILTGPKSQISEYASLLGEEFNLSVEVLDHLENIELEKGFNISSIGESVSFSSILGLALSFSEPRINLLPEEVKERTLFLEKKRQLIKTLSLAGFAFLVILCLLGFNFYTKKKIIHNLDSSLEKINPTAKQIEDTKNKMAVIKHQLDDENSCLEILREIHKITPQNLYLSTFIYEEDKAVTLKGMAQNMSLVFNFVPILNKSPFFHDVEVRYVTQRKTQIGEMTDFEIICPLRKRMKEK